MFYAKPPVDIFRTIGRIIPILVIAITIAAASKRHKYLIRTAIVANAFVSLMAIAVFIMTAMSGELPAGLVVILTFIPFIVNTYFLVRRH